MRYFWVIVTAPIFVASQVALSDIRNTDRFGNEPDADITVAVSLPQAPEDIGLPSASRPVSVPGPAPAYPQSRSPETTGAWTQVSSASAWRAVLPTDTALTAMSQGGSNIRGVMGPKAVLTKWNSVSFDAENACIYAFGGGHFDYGGNEVYRYCIGGTWERLTDPAPYVGETLATDRNGKPYKLPLSGPQSVHTYGGVLYHPTRKSLILTAFDAEFTQNDVYIAYPQLPQKWEFKIATRTWEKFDVPQSPRMGFSVYVPTTDSVYAIGKQGKQLIIGPGRELAGSVVDRAAQQVAEYDAKRNVVWSIYSAKSALNKWDITPTGLKRISSVSIPQAMRDAMKEHAAIAERQGVLWFFGGDAVSTYDPDANKWEIIPRPAVAPSNQYAFRKFFYWPREDKFVAVARDGGVWLYDPSAAAGEAVDPYAKRAEVNGAEYRTIAAAVAAAGNGDTVTIYPGTYREAIRVTQDDLTIKAHGVTISEAVYGGKSWAVQLGDRLTIEGIAAKNLANTDGNGYLVKMEPAAAGLTLRGVSVRDSQGGFVQSGNGTGAVVVEDSLSERNGYAGQAHGIYVGSGVTQATCRGSQFLGGRGLGHLFKSRSQNNLLDSCVLDGLDTSHSRVIDIPCGGVLHIRQSTLRQSPNADNRDLIAIAVEACREYPGRPKPWESRVIFEDVKVVATKPNARLFTVKEPLTIECRGLNEFIGVASPCSE